MCPGLFGVISDKSCFTIFHLVMKPANITSVAICLKLMHFLPFILFCYPFFFLLVSKLLLSPLLQSAWLSGQYFQFFFCLSLLSSIYCLHLFNKHISEMVFLWPSHFFFLFNFILCSGKVYFMRRLYRQEKAKKKMEINHCWIIWYILFLDYKISKRNHWEISKFDRMMIKHGTVGKQNTGYEI